MDLVLAGGGIAILQVNVWTVMGARRAAQVEAKARDDFARTKSRGALPPSLYPKVDLAACIGSGTCIQVCPEKDVLGLVSGKAQLVNPTSCIGHGECLRACPVDAIQLVIGSERRGVDIPLLDKDFATTVPGIYIVGELGGMGLIYNAMTQAQQCIDSIVSKKLPHIDGVHQVLIVGAGPAGISASLGAMEAKLDFVTLDQESVGGTVLHYPRHKIVMTKPVKLPVYGPMKVSTVAKEDLLEVWQDIVEKTGLEVQTKTKVESVTKGDDGLFEVKTSGGDFRTQTVILAMGRRGSPRPPASDTGRSGDVHRL